MEEFRGQLIKNKPYIVQRIGNGGARVSLGSLLEFQQGDELYEYKMPNGDVLLTKVKR